MAIGEPTHKQTNIIAFGQLAGSRRRRSGRGSSSYGGDGHRSSGLRLGCRVYGYDMRAERFYGCVL